MHWVHTSARAALLAATSLLGGSLYGMTAGIATVWWAAPPPHSFALKRIDSSAAVVGAMVGGAVGLVSAVYLIPLLWRTRLLLSVPFVVTLTLVSSAVSGKLGVASLPLSIVSNGLLCAAAAIWFRLPGAGDPFLCSGCGYDLRDIPRGVCPECGMAKPTSDL